MAPVLMEAMAWAWNDSWPGFWIGITSEMYAYTLALSSAASHNRCLLKHEGQHTVPESNRLPRPKEQKAKIFPFVFYGDVSGSVFSFCFLFFIPATTESNPKHWNIKWHWCCHFKKKYPLQNLGEIRGM